MAFPVNQQNISDVNVAEYLESRGEAIIKTSLLGVYPSTYIFNGVNTPAANGSTNIATPATIVQSTVPPDEIAIVKSVTGSSTRSILLYIIFAENHIYGVTRGASGFYFMTPATTNNFVIPTNNRLVRGNGTLQANFFGCVDATGGNWVATASFDTVSITNDLDIEANKVVVLVSDSIGKGTFGTGVTFTRDDLYLFQMKKWLWDNKTLGDTNRVINYSYGGIGNVLSTVLCSNGQMDLRQCDLLLHCMGINDFDTNPHTQLQIDTAISNLNNLIAKKQSRFPNAKMIIIGSTPANNNNREAGLTAFRAAQATRVAQLADPNITYCSLANAFDRTNLANYASSDGVHPSKASHQLIAPIIQAHMTANNIKI